MSNKVIETIKNRVSCRSYSDKKVPLKKINEIVEAGKMAPSAVNRQIANILVVKSKRYVNKLRELSLAKRLKDCYYGANVMILVYAPRDDKFTIQDCSVILQNMFVAATALNINSCWINQTDELLQDKDGLKVRKLLGLTPNDYVVGTCILGYKKDDCELKVKPRKEDFVRII